LSTLVQFASLFKNSVLLRRVIAAVILFAVPGIYLLTSVDDIDVGLHLTKPGLTLLSMFVFSGIAVGVNKYSEVDTRSYPQLRVAHWTPRVFAVNAFTWIFYLFSYEFLFRGFLFFHCLAVFPLWQTCSINVVIYAVYHLPKGIKETLLCVPFGVLLCILTAYTGNIWSAVVIHIALALSNEYYAVEATRRKKQSDYVFGSE
jgi:membrane protease YdiL (CAAX protease family)